MSVNQFQVVWLRTAITLFCASLISSPKPARGDPGKDMADLTASHSRVVWVQDQSATNGDTLAFGRELKLMGFDSLDGRGERAIVADVQSFAKPMLTSDGKRIIYSDRFSKDHFVVNWDGTGKRRIASGYAVEVWTDPVSGTTWVYACTQAGKPNSINFKSLRRIALDEGSRWETVWDKTEISPDNFQLSANGAIAAGEFPWPNGGTADLNAKTWRKRADGCWASLAPDNSGLCWVFDGPHRNVYLYPLNSSTGWKVPINTAPGIENYEVFHPRWSNHVRYFGMTGPYKTKSSINNIAGGGPEVEVYVGQFAADFRSVERWVRITNNTRGDFHPDVWIDGSESSTIPPDVLKLAIPDAPIVGDWPGTSDGLIFVWENASAPNLISSTDGTILRNCRVEARGKVKYNRFFDMDCAGGSFVAERIGRDLLDACQKTHELTIEAAVSAGRADQTGPARILSFCSNTSTANFMLGQDRDTLVFELNTKGSRAAGNHTVRLGKIPTERLMHVVLSYSSEKLNCYIDGKPVSVTDNIQGDFSGWTEQQLVFGNDYLGKHNWTGRLEGIAIFNRSLTADEALRHFELFSARLDNRQPVDRVRVRAKCLEISQIPDPRTIVPYRRALVVNRYRIEKVLTGNIEAREILVAQWGILDKSVVTESKVRADQFVELTIEDFEDHPELRSERQIVDVEGLDLPLFYAVGK